MEIKVTKQSQKIYHVFLLFEHVSFINWIPFTWLDYLKKYGMTGRFKHWSLFFCEKSKQQGYKIELDANNPTKTIVPSITEFYQADVGHFFGSIKNFRSRLVQFSRKASSQSNHLSFFGKELSALCWYDF